MNRAIVTKACLGLLLMPLVFQVPVVRAQTVRVTDTGGNPVATAMVSRTVSGSDTVDTSDNGYPKEGVINRVTARVTRFTGANGNADFGPPPAAGMLRIRVRAQGYRDAAVEVLAPAELAEIALVRILDAQELAETKPSNLWLSKLDFSWAEDPVQAEEHFLLHCGFCHQQASPVMRLARTEQQWRDILERMNTYGAMAAGGFVDPAAAALASAYPALTASFTSLPDFETWHPALQDATIEEWPIGDNLSQMHDFVLHPNGKIYVGDNLMDRIYEVDPESGRYRVFKVPHQAGARIGGILGDRLNTYPKAENYSGVHSFAVAPGDGHIFLTPSMQRKLIEFDPESGEFVHHLMDEGFYPHTIRADDRDRIWFTLALSSQVGMFDRRTRSFTFFDLPPRGIKERIVLWIAKRKLASGDISSPPDYDWDSSGFPMPYGIDVSPVDGSIWVARLYARDIARIDAESGNVQMIETPFAGPRRLRIDVSGNVWIAGFASGLIAKYDPLQKEFSTYALPVTHETPYALNVDRQRGIVWVNGNQSDSILSFDIERETWRVYPLTQRRSFTRDIEIAVDGSVFTSNSHFPGWMIEDGQPTLIRVTPQRSEGVKAAKKGAELYQAHCATCHANPEVKAPTLATLNRMTVSRILQSLEFGRMQVQGSLMSAEDRFLVASYLAAPGGEQRDAWIGANACQSPTTLKVIPQEHNNWGFGTGNRRALARDVPINPKNLQNLELKWSLAIPGATEMRSQPLAAFGVLFLGTSNGNLLALDGDSGCVLWHFQARSSIRSSLNLETTEDGVATLFFADDLANVYAVSANDGTLRWRQSLRWFPTSVISGSLAFHDQRLFVPVSSFEVAIAGLDSYPCCRSHGGVAALDATDGKTLWEYRTTAHAEVTGNNSAGAEAWGPSGASVWTTPAIDARRGVLYVGSGENTSPPATDTSDAVIALDLVSGSRRWIFQALAGDVWNAACLQGGANCPADAGEDFDFGGGLTLAPTAEGRELLIAGQKSGVLFALDPDKDGQVLWQTRLSMGTSNGGIHWGVASDASRVYVTIADPPRATPGYKPNPGVFAVSLASGELLWSSPVERGCAISPADVPKVGLAAMQDAANRNPWPDCSFYYGHSAAPLLANGIVYAGALDGKMRMLDADDGTVLRIIDTRKAYAATNGIEGHGGAIDLSGVVVDGDRLFITSGYGMFGQMPGNVLLAYQLLTHENRQTASGDRQ